MIETAQKVFNRLEEKDQIILKTIYGSGEAELSNEAKRLKNIIDTLSEEDRSLVFSIEVTDESNTTTTEIPNSTDNSEEG